MKEIVVPDIGGSANVDVIEVLVAPGDNIAKDQSLLTLEGDKASMEIPSPCPGLVKEVKVKVGDKVSQGSLILLLEVAESEAETVVPAKSETHVPPKPQQVSPPSKPSAISSSVVQTTQGVVYAAPSIRRLARELGVDLSRVQGSGRKNRITKEDVFQFVKGQMTGAGGSGLSVTPMPEIDFSQFGEVATVSLNKIKRLTAQNLHRNWVTVPHVTQFIEADITELTQFRQDHKKKAEQQGFKLTPLVFIMKAVENALKTFPQFNSSLSSDGNSLILKKYYNIGVAVDTPNGLVVPVIREVDKKNLSDLASELASISAKAREKGLALSDMQGGCFTISSLGGIGGSAFTPIVNCPEVAILGVAKSEYKPVYYPKKDKFKPHLLLPLSLSYDHRVIDGAEAARFAVALTDYLADMRLFKL